MERYLLRLSIRWPEIVVVQPDKVYFTHQSWPWGGFAIVGEGEISPYWDIDSNHWANEFLESHHDYTEISPEEYDWMQKNMNRPIEAEIGPFERVL